MSFWVICVAFFQGKKRKFLIKKKLKTKTKTKKYCHNYCMRLLHTVLKNLFFLIIISVTHGTPSSSPGEYTRGDKDKKKKDLKNNTSLSTGRRGPTQECNWQRQSL